MPIPSKGRDESKSPDYWFLLSAFPIKAWATKNVSRYKTRQLIVPKPTLWPEKGLQEWTLKQT